MSRTMFPCRNCGWPVPVPFGGTASEILIEDNLLVCPHCGRNTPVPSGTYNFLDDVVVAFRSANPNELWQLKAIAAQASAGEISTDEAVSLATSVRPEFGRVVMRALAWGIPSVLGPAISIYLAWQTMKSSDKSGADMLNEIQHSTAVNEQILMELRHLSDMQSASPPPAQRIPKLSTNQSKAGAPTNRHERRKAERLSKPRAGPGR